MPVKNPRSRFQNTNLSERGSTRYGADYSMPGTAESADPTAPPSVSYHGCKVRKTGNQTVNNGDNDVMFWQQDVYDTDNIHASTGVVGLTSITRFTVPQGLSGFWKAQIHISCDADTAAKTRADVRLEKNTAGTHTVGDTLQVFRFQGDDNTGGWMGDASDSVRLEAGDYVEWFFESLDENRVLQSGGAGGCFAIFEYLGPAANAEVE